MPLAHFFVDLEACTYLFKRLVNFLLSDAHARLFYQVLDLANTLQ